MNRRKIIDKRLPLASRNCNHPRAVLFDPSDDELAALEEMLARCPVCSHWSPGNGPIMAIVPKVPTGSRPAGITVETELS